jgi:hypothetical protein
MLLAIFYCDGIFGCYTGDDKDCCDLKDGGSAVMHHHSTEQNARVESGIFEIPVSTEGKTDTDLAVIGRRGEVRNAAGTTSKGALSR